MSFTRRLQPMTTQADTFEHMAIRTFTPSVSGEITCGVRRNGDVVIVTYKPIHKASVSVDGRATALEFVPNDFKLKQ
ncbi:MAG: hypothetical protein ABJC05_02630 [Pyrinomonadaceae bacterium]